MKTNLPKHYTNIKNPVTIKQCTKQLITRHTSNSHHVEESQQRTYCKLNLQKSAKTAFPEQLICILYCCKLQKC